MSRYFVRVTSELFIENDKGLRDYIEDRETEWGDDEPGEIQRLKDVGLCMLKDEDGVTTISIRKIEPEDCGEGCKGAGAHYHNDTVQMEAEK